MLATGRGSLCIVILLFLLLAVGNLQAQEATPEAVGTAQRLLFVSERDGNREIYVVNDDGTGLQNLTNNPAEDAYPIWSPDGSRIAFQSNRDGNWEIYVMDADGDNAQNLTNDPADDERPTWAVRSEHIYYQSTDNQQTDINSVDLSGTIFEYYTLPNQTRNPVVSPDGSEFAHLGDQTGYWQLYSDDYAFVRPITYTRYNIGRVSWSPDSQALALELNGEIYRATIPLGSRGIQVQVIDLTLSEAFDSSPAWSPAGNQIAYVSNWDIYTMNATDGTEAYNLTHNPAYDVSPAWSPDAQQVAFASFRDDNWEIYAMHSNGCNVRRLTDDDGWDGLPQWQPQTDVSATIVERAPTAIVTTPNANLRDGAGENFAVVATAAQGDCLTISGRNLDSAWLQIQHDEAILWVSASIVEIVGNLSDVPTLER